MDDKEIIAATECYDILRDAAVSMELSRRPEHESDFHELVESSIASVQEEIERFAHYITQRNAALDESLEKESGESIDVSDDHLFAVFDQRHIKKRDKRKWYHPASKIGTSRGNWRLTKKRGICIHGTAVSGGFGIHKNRLNLYTGKEIDWEHWIQQPDHSAIPPLELQMLWARAMALGHRYRGDLPSKNNTGVSYHAISGGNSVLYLNLDFDWVTWHGDGSNNSFLGYALDFHSQKDSIIASNDSKYHPEDLKKDLLFLIDKAREEDHEIAELTCHCAWTNKPNDPGKEYIEMVMVPVAKQTGCFIDYDFKTGNGRSIADVLSA